MFRLNEANLDCLAPPHHGREGRLPAPHRSHANFCQDNADDATFDGLAADDDAYMRSIWSVTATDSPAVFDNRFAELPRPQGSHKNASRIDRELPSLAEGQALYPFPSCLGEEAFAHYVRQEYSGDNGTPQLLGFRSRIASEQHCQQLASNIPKSILKDTGNDVMSSKAPPSTIRATVSVDAGLELEAPPELRLLEQQHAAKFESFFSEGLRVTDVETFNGTGRSLLHSSSIDGNLASRPVEQQRLKPNIKPENYKTELCRHWEEMGTCHLGEKCLFAHGHAELRPRERHPLYKTKPCITFIRTGKCAFGKRCTYMHPSSLNAKTDEVFDSGRHASMLERFGRDKKTVKAALAVAKTSSWNAHPEDWSKVAFGESLDFAVPSRRQSITDSTSASVVDSTWLSTSGMSPSASRRDSSASSSLSLFEVTTHKAGPVWPSPSS